MRLLFLGDIVGSPGVALVKRAVPILRTSERLDLVVANAENATHGSGLNPRDYRILRTAGVDAVTMGDHIYKKFDLAEILTAPREPICKPANYPPTAPGRDHIVVSSAMGVGTAVISLMGRTFMRAVDCPFAAVDRVLAYLQPMRERGDVKLVVVDIHAEATADKYLMAHYLHGRVTAVFGTHTHIQTADEQVYTEGTAFICDVGMTGPYEGILGRKVEPVLRAAMTFEPTKFDVAEGDVRLAGAIVEVDVQSGRATSIRRVMLSEKQFDAGVK